MNPSQKRGNEQELFTGQKKDFLLQGTFVSTRTFRVYEKYFQLSLWTKHEMYFKYFAYFKQ